MERVGAWRLADAAGWEPWLLRVGVLEFAAGIFLPDEPSTIAVNALLLRGHGQTVLVDAGSGPADVLYPGAASLDEALARAGATTADVDVVVLTHLDFDHAGGALEGQWDGELTAAFPRAVLSAVDFDHWRTSPGEGSAIPAPIVAAYPGDRLELAPDGAEFLPGLRLVSAPGHREGHCVVLVGDELVHAVDIVHHEEHLAHPDWEGYYDVDPVASLATRLAWLDRLAADGTRVVFSHLASAGRVGPGRAWLPDW